MCYSREGNCEEDEDVDCVDSWSLCDENCRRTQTIDTHPSGDGLPCTPEPSCSPGENQCPPEDEDRDCEGEWSGCDARCKRTWTTMVEPIGNGTPCPTEMPTCDEGEDLCVRAPECMDESQLQKIADYILEELKKT
eukprot:UN26631